MTRLGIVTGLADEADCLGSVLSGADVTVLCAGADSGRAERAACRLIDQGCEGLLSFGMAGGLDPGLVPGAVILPHRILDPDGGALAVAVDWRRRLADLMASMGPGEGDIAGSAELVDSPAAKRQLRLKTMAAAVDMESLALARAARQAGVPFLVLRVVADPAHRAPPPWAMAAVDSDGRVRPLVALRALIRRPADLPTAIGLARDNRIALAALRRVAVSVGPLFGL
jgi:adenosylhomocysteine nucleosidase